MKALIVRQSVPLAGLATLLFCLNLAAQETVMRYPSDLLTRVRDAADSILGDFPQSIAYAKVAESHRAYSAIIEDGSEETFVSARTAFQIRYAQNSIMIDSGMDLEVHTYYGFGRDEPYFANVNQDVQLALFEADQILITHEHGDHVAGVIRSPFFQQIASKTLVTEAQVNTLINSPQLPQIQLTQEQADQLRVVEYGLTYPVAPGIVLIKSPGHTPGHQMIYVKTAADREYLFVGDIGWSMFNFSELKLRPESTRSRIGENAEALMNQMVWIREVMDEEGLIVVPSHDNILLEQYAAEGLLGNSLRL